MRPHFALMVSLHPFFPRCIPFSLLTLFMKTTLTCMLMAVCAAAFAVQPTQKDSLSVALGKKQKEKKRGIDELMEV